MIPIGRPFLDYVLSALADAGLYRRLSRHRPGAHCDPRRTTAAQACSIGVRVSFAIQEKPVGTANAILAVEPFVKEDRFLVMNADNYYPVAAYAALRDLGEPGLVAFGRDALLANGHIAAERILRFALLDVDDRGYLRRIVEKPDDATARAMQDTSLVSMNLWAFDAGIFEPCRTVPISPRGELELPVAVQHAIDTYGRRFRTVPLNAPVLDLSSRSDIAGVAKALVNVDVSL